MLPFALFRERNFAAANVETFLVYAGLYGFLVFFTLYLQFLGFTPFEAGLLNIPVERRHDRARRPLRRAGRPARAAALPHGRAGADRRSGRWSSASSRRRTDFWTYGIVALLLFSFGLAMMVAPITSTALKSAPERYAGIASGVNSTVSRLGSLIAVAVIGLIISLVFEAQTDVADAVPLAKDQAAPELRDASIAGFRAGMVLAAALAFAGAAVGALWISNREARGERRRRQRTGTGASRKLSAAARSRQRATASSRVSPTP